LDEHEANRDYNRGRNPAQQQLPEIIKATRRVFLKQFH
jgi:hypothetical protein